MTRPLIVALHGVGATAANLAAALRPLEAVAEVIAIDGAERFDRGGTARQWFSVAGVTEADRPHRVARALPALLHRLDRIASDRHIRRQDLIMLGFSQGAIMTLAMVAGGLHPGRAIAIAGRLAAPVVAGGRADVLLVHDRADRVMSPALSAEAAMLLADAGHRTTPIFTDHIGHAIGPDTLTAITNWLAATTVPHATPLKIEG